MKRVFKIIFVITFALMIPFSFILGQEKKSEQKIKIIVKDGSETKVIVDTVFNEDHGPDSLTLKDGSVVYLNHPGVSGKKHYSVSYSSDDKDGGDEIREITVITSDSMDINDSGHGNVMYYRNGSSGDNHHRYKVISRSSGDNVDKEVWRDVEDERDSDSGVDKTRFIIAKDGMVVTIEGTDEAKAKELAKEIEKSLGVSEKEVTKEVTKTKSGRKINK